MPGSKVKILVIGESSVGKSALLCRFADDIFNNKYTATVSVDFKCKKVEIDGEPMELQIWDTAGQERFRNVTSAYYRGAMGVFLVYDLTDRKSFERIDTWMSHVSRHASNDITRMLIGNKADLAEQGRAVSTEEGQAVADKLGIPFMETSAKENMNVDEAFQTICRAIRKASKDEPRSNVPKTIELQPVGAPTEKDSGCCS
eukprot:TRINITY_DN60869_c0_g1_i3.p1 TRINITY_DN60869_c0_g1~~TRINITY_DN60869_c0_g1_i3.p1  ORF type:complete len:201 (-),score=29.40 TRINITY_DN60869_c0_g1_i3:438-1040(-)